MYGGCGFFFVFLSKETTRVSLWGEVCGVKGEGFKKKKKKMINCWSSVVASVVLPQLCNLHCYCFVFCAL